MQRDARIPIADLADRVVASTASVQRRLGRLRADGTIAAEVALVEPGRAGLTIAAIITVELERDGTGRTDAVKRRAVAEPNVRRCYGVADDTNFVLIVVVRDMRDYEAITARFFSDETVRHYRSSIVVSRVETSTRVSIARDDG